MPAAEVIEPSAINYLLAVVLATEKRELYKLRNQQKLTKRRLEARCKTALRLTKK